MEYKNQEELYKALRGAFHVKMRLLKEKGSSDIQMIDLWNYLKITKWCKDQNLTLSEMVNDIITVDATKIISFKEKINKTKDKE